MIHNDPFNDGETLTISVNTVDFDGLQTVTLRDAADAVTYGTLRLLDGASATFTLPAGATGLRFQVAGPFGIGATNLVISCTAAPATPGTTRSDVGSDFGQAARHITSRTSAAAVENFAGFVGSAVQRRFAMRGASGNAAPVDALADGATAFGADADPQAVMTAALLGRPEPAGSGGIPMVSYPTDSAGLADGRPAEAAQAAQVRGFWTAAATTVLDDDRTGGAFSGTVTSVGSGIDMMVGETTLAGLAVAYERGDIDSAFNNGGLESNAVSLAPYVGWRLGPNVVVDATVGITLADYDMDRNFGAVSGDFDATRIFGAVNVTGDFRRDGWRLSPGAGVLFYSERQSAYTDSAGTRVSKQTIPLGRLKAGLEAGYSFTLGEGACVVEPYVRLEGEWDFIRADAVTLTTGTSARPGRGGASVAVGLKVLDRRGWSGTLEASYDTIGRSDQDSATVKGSLVFPF